MILRTLFVSGVVGGVMYAVTRRSDVAAMSAVGAGAGYLIGGRKRDMDLIVLSNEQPAMADATDVVVVEHEVPAAAAGTRRLAGCGCQTFRLRGRLGCNCGCAQLL
jgi:hypothetical protein